MILAWLRDRRRRRLQAEPFPSAWLEHLEANVRAYAPLDEPAQARVRAYVQVFVAEKNWEGCGGLRMTDEIRVTIAAHAAILTLGFREPHYFDHVLSVLVYPETYVAQNRSMLGGAVTEGDSVRLGEAWYRGPVILAWRDVLAAGRGQVRGNVVYHEFAHQLDMLNGGSCDGNPPLLTRDQDERWLAANDEAYARLVQDCEQGRATLIDCYGATNRAEFFAVTTETFFTRPQALRDRHPELYATLREFYGQDPPTNE